MNWTTGLKELGEACTKNGQSLECKDAQGICQSNACSCNSGFYDNNFGTAAGTCVAGVGGSCAGVGTATECSDKNFVCSTETGGKLAPGGGCSQDVQCVANAECSSTENMCRCKDNFYDNDLTDSGVGGVCTLKKGVGDKCTAPGTTTECSDSFSSCTTENGGESKCRCTANYYDSDLDNSNIGGTCTRKKELGAECTNNVQCLDLNSECGIWSAKSVCYCKLGFYDNNNVNIEGTCIALNELKVGIPTLTLRSETYLEIEWTAPTASGAVEEFQYQVGSGIAISVNQETTANVTGLTPGSLYTIRIISVDTNSGPTTQTTYVEISFATMPAVPGPLDLANSDIIASDGQITIKWKSTGTVMSYTVTISELVTTPTKVYVPYQVIGGYVAKNGYRYTLTVKAHSNSLESAEYTEVFRTVITQPQPPTVRSTCLDDDPKSTSIYVRWQAPTFPNGDILYYLVDTVSGPTIVPQFNTSTKVLDQKVEPLQEAKQYCFTVKTVNDGPDNIRTSVPSSQQCCYTRAGLSTVPTSVMHSTTSRSITISWSKPNNTKGDLTGYRLRVRSSDGCVVEVILKCSTGCTPMGITRICPSDKRLIQEDRNSTELMTSMAYVIDKLLPYTDYEVWINAINAAGDGDRTETSVQTDSEVPQKPLSVVALVMGSSEITVTWNQSLPRPGVTKYYIEAYEVVLNADPKFVKFSNLTGFSPQTTTFSGLEAYWNYTFSVVAATDKGNSEQSEKSGTATTLQDAPGAVLKLKVGKPTNSFTQMNVSWSIPLLRDRNGVINKYTIEHNVTGIITSTTVNATMDNLEKIFEITPERSYNIKVYAVNTEGTKGEEVVMSYDALPGPPNVPAIPALVEEIASPPSTQTTIKVKFSLDWFLNTDNGERTDGGIIVCPASSCDNYGVSSDMKSPAHFTTTLSTWKESKAIGFTIPYRVTSRTWIEDNRNTTSRRKRSNQEVELTIGEESGCDKLADDVYCNGPLPADIRILVIAFVCTSGGCTESKQFGPYKTQPEPEGLPIAIIAGAVSAVVVFLIVIIIIVVIKKQKRSRSHDRIVEDEKINDFTNLNPHGLETPSVERKNIRKKRPIKLKDFEDKVAELHKDSNLKFAHEYEEVKTLTDPKTLKNVSTSLAETEENKLKNRYVNILPYDHTIVKLLPLEDDDEQASTFINANYIPGYKSQREYIASQGPIPSTIDDFWRMVWEQSVSIIVMLTLAKEDGRIKCEMYWPTEQSEAKQFGDIVVEMQSCSTINTYEFRIFKMTLGDKSRSLKHFHFLNWKDFSANVQNDVMVDFISNVRSHVTIPESRVPMIVHCSAGVGRTGTFIALDHMMQFIRDHDFDSTIDIFDFVVKMRECRMYMVQTEQQYIFIHDCIKDILEKKRQKELEDGDGLYGNVDNNQDHNIYSNEAFEPEPELYQNFEIGQPKTEL
ncbi:tyrosine-protein phosphatase 10D-like [Mytilus trossulus]|uniref:tyrosine-protein phosphatase 10D-like n=1 Tax=Mytilus trossulus TaxID=6551 RepID=UPI003003B298